MKQPKTNIELVTELMEYSKNGALTQVYIISALQQWSEYVVNNKDEVIQGMTGSIIHGEAWVQCAEEVLETITNRS